MRLKIFSLIRQIWSPDYGPPPAPQTDDVPTFNEEKIVEIIYSTSQRTRIFITVDKNGIFRTYSQYWDTSDWKDWKKAFWAASSVFGHTDNLERARELALEEMKFNQSREINEP